MNAHSALVGLCERESFRSKVRDKKVDDRCNGVW